MQENKSLVSALKSFADSVESALPPSFRREKKGCMNDFEKLNEIAKGNGGIKMFPLPGNLISANTGKDNWGRLTVAVDNASIGDILKDDVIGVLYLIERTEWVKLTDG